jgi:chaperonin GroES
MKKTKATKPRRKVGVPTKASGKKAPKTSISNKSGVTPLGDRVLVKPIVADDTTTSFGIIIPDTVSKEKPEQGIVVAVGMGKKNEEGKAVPLSVNVGDKVMFSKYGFDEIKVDGVEYYILPESSILAVLTK